MTYNLAPRKPLRGNAREAFLDAHGRRCYFCGQPILPDQPWHDEHEMARELGGSDDMSNRKPIHADPCHKIKTGRDRRLIAKGNRIRQKLSGLDPIRRKPRPKMKSRPNPWPAPGTQKIRKRKAI